VTPSRRIRYAGDLPARSPSYPGDMEVRRGPAAKLAGDLRDLAEGWHHLAKDGQRDQALAAARELDNGAESATAGHTIYEVTD